MLAPEFINPGRQSFILYHRLQFEKICSLSTKTKTLLHPITGGGGAAAAEGGGTGGGGGGGRGGGG